MRRKQPVRSDQRGIASIIITMITMVIISLIVLGFATLSRREQRQTLDHQLSTQALYAAESGIEDARNVIESSIAAGLSYKKDNYTTNNGAGFAAYPTPVDGSTRLGGDHGVSYTCLTVNDKPLSANFNGVGNSLVVPLNVDPSGPAISRVVIKWTPTGKPATDPASCPADTSNSLPTQTAWNCGYAMMRADLTLTDGPFTHASLAANTLSGFFEPLNNNPAGAGQLAYGGNTGKPNLIPAQCSQAASYDGCTATITGLPAGQFSAALRLNSLYQPSNVQIQVQSGAGVALPLSGVQAAIDATGKAQDVLRRIQVRLPLTRTGASHPGYAIQTNGSVCKRFLLRADYFAVDGGITDPDLANGMCDSSNIDTAPAAPPVANAGITSACGSSCAPGWTPPVGGKYKYTKTFTNQSNNPPGDVAGCTWDFGDGTPIVTDTACQFNDTLVNTSPTLSPEPPYPLACLTEHFTATLTVRLLSGATATKTHDYAMPLCV